MNGASDACDMFRDIVVARLGQPNGPSRPGSCLGEWPALNASEKGVRKLRSGSWGIISRHESLILPSNR